MSNWKKLRHGRSGSNLDMMLMCEVAKNMKIKKKIEVSVCGGDACF